MKIEQLVVQHLYNNKELSLQGFGTFRLKPREDNSKTELPGESVLQQSKDIIEFSYDTTAGEDNALLLYVVQQSGKMKALAAADIESYLVLAKQFLNIGKPFIIDGIGTLHKTQLGEYAFVQGAFVAPRLDEQSRPLREKQEEPISFKQEITSIITRRNMQLLVFALVILLFGIGLVYLIWGKKDEPIPPPVVQTTTVPVATDTTAKLVDSSKIKKDSGIAVIAPAPAPIIFPKVINDTNVHFKIIIKTYPTLDSVQNAYQRLRADGYRVMVYPDGTKYKIGLPCKCPLSDSTKMLDSIHMVFGGYTRIEH